MPYKMVRVKAPLFMRHKGVRVYHVYRHDDADGGVLRQFTFTLDPIDGSDELSDGKVTFDVCSLSTWAEPARPPFLTGKDDTPANRRAWKKHESEKVEEKAIKAAIRAALDKGEVGTTVDANR